jgi:hypothetical protein
MGVKEKIAQELNNENSIYLLKEGIFWRAYNQSAMRFVNNLKPLKIIRKYIKKVKQDIFYCGFPESSLADIRERAVEKGFQITETGGKKIVISGVSAEEDYKNWMENQKPLSPLGIGESVKKENDFDNIIQQIQQYPLENATPLETMMFVQKLKQSIKDGIIL